LNYNNQKSKFVKKKFYFWIFSLDGISTDEIATYEIATPPCGRLAMTKGRKNTRLPRPPTAGSHLLVQVFDELFAFYFLYGFILRFSF